MTSRNCRDAPERRYSTSPCGPCRSENQPPAEEPPRTLEPATNTRVTSFRSILFGDERPLQGDAAKEPEFFRDLNLDQVVEAITSGYGEYDLKPFFYAPLTDLESIAYRQEIMRDVDSQYISQGIKTFSAQMRAMHNQLAIANSGHYTYSNERWFLDAAGTYCEAVAQLRDDLRQDAPKSRGLKAFQAYLASYAESARFTTLARKAEMLQSDLSAIRYCVLFKDGCVTVHKYEMEPDYALAVEETFAKFRQRDVRDYRIKLTPSSGMNHVQNAILERVARLIPDPFRDLDDFCTRNGDFIDEVIARFDREIQFYVAYRAYIKTFTRCDLRFCYPEVSDACKSVESRAGFDLALAHKLLDEGATVVCNDFVLDAEERILVVTGANRGGKTTFTRTFGQMHYLASLGCPVPGSRARLFLCNRLFTHFERVEDIATLRGKLQDDLVRIHEVLTQATPQSIVILNEVFASTTVADAVEMGRKILEQITKLDALCVCVTFLDELAALNEKTVSMVAMVDPDDAARRTYRIERRPADGRAYAVALARKYGLTYERLKERIDP